jgi:hypothetical protein
MGTPARQLEPQPAARDARAPYDEAGDAADAGFGASSARVGRRPGRAATGTIAGADLRLLSSLRPADSDA